MRFSAGFCGSDVRGDCRATVWLDDSPTIEIRSRVQALYGEALKTQSEEVLEACNSRGLSLLLEDEGALPFTVGARIETALKRAQTDLSTQWLPKAIDIRPKNTTGRRSRLYLPGNTPKFLINAGLYGADALILDLEDSVAPTEKDAARIMVRNALRAIDFGDAELMVRINSGELAETDVQAVAGHGVQTLILPKTESARQVQAIDLLAGNQLNLIPLIETARGIANAHEIAHASPRVVALSVGLEDYLADIGAQRSEAGTESAWALSQIVNAARAAGIDPLGPMFAGIGDEEALERQVCKLTNIGFEGFSCIHPAQIRPIHKAMMPSQDEIHSAEQTLSSYREAVAAGKGAVAVAGQMVDAPVAARAERVLRRAGRSR